MFIWGVMQGGGGEPDVQRALCSNLRTPGLGLAGREAIDILRTRELPAGRCVSERINPKVTHESD